MISTKDLPLIRVLSKLKPEDIPPLIDVLPDEATEIICECVYNVLHTDIKLSPKKKSHLKKFIKNNCNIHRLEKIREMQNDTIKRDQELKAEKQKLRNALLLLYNSILATGEVPAVLRDVIITVLYKGKGARDDCTGFNCPSSHDSL